MLEKLQPADVCRHITVIKDGNQVRMVELVGIHNMSQKDTSSVMDMNFVCFLEDTIRMFTESFVC